MKKRIKVIGMTCSACSSHVEKEVRKLDGISSANVSLMTNTLEVEYKEDVLSVEMIEQAVIKSGYGVDKQPDNNEYIIEVNKLKQKKLHKLWISVVLLIVLMYVSMGPMIGFWLPPFLVGMENAVYHVGLQFILTIPILILNRNYFISGFTKLFKRHPNMDSLVAIGSFAAVIYGVFSLSMLIYAKNTNNMDVTMKYHMNIYFESAATILTLVSVGKYLESKSKGKTSEAITKLLNLTSKVAIKIQDNEEIEVDAKTLLEGDFIIIKPGMIIPVDSVVVKGNTSVDESAITGESLPVSKKEGDKVISATINGLGIITARVEKRLEDSTISKIVEMVEAAANSKAPIARLADKVSGIFVPIVITIALITFIIWMISGYGYEFSLEMAISVLVISCPCALGLATPVAIMIGTGIAAKNHIMIKSAESLETLHRVDTVLLDKTGTITKGELSVNSIICYDIEENKLLSIMASLEKNSSHPLAQAILNLAIEKNIILEEVQNFHTEIGFGISGYTNNQEYYCGNVAYAKQKGLDVKKITKDVENISKQGQSILILFDEKQCYGMVGVADVIKETSVEAIRIFKKMGIKPYMLTGDNENTAKVIASIAGITDVYSGLLPMDKDKVVEQLQREGHKVAMIGDGINDSIALTKADVGIAIGAGTDVAIESADVVLIKSDLIDAANAIHLSKKTISIVKMNLFWAFFYNAIGIPIAAGVLFPIFHIKLNPMLASLAMSLSSISVVLNATRLTKYKNIEMENKQMKKEFFVYAMMCDHCKKRVYDAMMSIEGVNKCEIDLKKKKVSYESEEEIMWDTILNVIAEAGYEATLENKKGLFRRKM